MMADDGSNTLPATRSVLMSMSERYGMEPAPFEATVRATCGGKDFSREEFAAFLLVAKEYRLNPITREIFAFKGKSGAVIPVVSVDGWLRIMNEHPAMDGLDIQDVREDGKLIAVCAKVYRKDRSQPISVTEYLNECMQDKDTWRKWPARMLRHKATIQACRYAFGFAGIYDQDEAERIQTATVEHSSYAPGVVEHENADGQVVIASRPDGHEEAFDGFQRGELKDLLINHYDGLFKAAKSETEIGKIFDSFKRKFYNGTTKKVAALTFNSIEGMRDEAEARIEAELTRLANDDLDRGIIPGQERDNDGDEANT